MINKLDSSTFEELLQRLHSQGCNPRPSSDRQWHSACPAHEDENASLAVGLGGDGRVLVCCHAGCRFEEVIERLGFAVRDFYPTSGVETPRSKAPPDLDLEEARIRLLGDMPMLLALEQQRGFSLKAVRDYGIGADPEGRIVVPYRGDGRILTVEKHDILRRTDGPKAKAQSGRARTLLMPPRGFDGARVVFITEGPADAIAGFSAGLVTVGAPSAMWKSSWTSLLNEARATKVCVVGDCDAAGRTFARDAASSLRGVGIDARIIDLAPTQDDGFDLSDWLRVSTAVDVEQALLDLAADSEIKPKTGDKFRVRTANLKEVKPMLWLWKQWIMRDVINLIVGEEGIGKSTFAADIVARLSVGELDGELFGEAGDVLMVAAEDSFDHVWAPRLHAANADLDRVHVAEGADGIVVPNDIDDLREMIQDTDAKLVVFDQLLDNLPPGVDEFKQKPVRHALMPLRELAEEMQIAVLCSLHRNKSKTGDFRHMVYGSTAFNAVSRSSILVAKHPTDPDLRVVARAKGNFGRVPDPLSFTIQERRPLICGRVIETSIATDFRRCGLSLDEILAGPQPERHSRTAEAVRALTAKLADGKAHPAKEIYAALEGEGFSRRTITNASHKCGVKSQREGFQGAFAWSLSPQAHTEQVIASASGEVEA